MIGEVIEDPIISQDTSPLEASNDELKKEEDKTVSENETISESEQDGSLAFNSGTLNDIVATEGKDTDAQTA